MVDTPVKTRPKRVKKWHVLAVLLAVLVVVNLTLDTIATFAVNRALSAYFPHDARVHFVTIHIWSGRLSLWDLQLSVSPEYGQTPAIEITHLSLGFDLSELLNGAWRFDDLALNGGTITVIRQGQGPINLATLIGDPDTTNATAVKKMPAPGASSENQGITWQLDQLTVENLQLRLQDLRGAEPWQAQLELWLDLAGVSAVEGSDRGIPLQWSGGKLLLSAVTFDPVIGYSDQPVLTADQLSLTTGQQDLTAREWNWPALEITGVAGELHFNREGSSNVGELIQRLGTFFSSQQAPASQSASLPVIRIDSVAVQGDRYLIAENYQTEDIRQYPLTDITIAARDLRFGEEADDQYATVSLSAKTTQRATDPVALVDVRGRLGPIGNDLPMVNLQAVVSGFMLDTLGSIIPPGTKTALGADGMDADGVLVLDSDHIFMDALLHMDNGATYNAIRIDGPIAEPSVQIQKVWSGAFTRVMTGFRNIGKEGLEAGTDIAGTGVQVVETVGSGALDIGGRIGSGVFKLGKGIVTMDLKGAASAIMPEEDGTDGTVKAEAEASESDWVKDIPQRHAAAVAAAEKALAAMPYPPNLEQYATGTTD